MNNETLEFLAEGIKDVEEKAYRLGKAEGYREGVEAMLSREVEVMPTIELDGELLAKALVNKERRGLV